MAKFKNQDLLLDDNEQILLGDDDDATIYWDGSDLITNQLLKHSTEGYYATKAYVEQTVAGLEWQDSVLSATTDIPISPNYEDRYIVPSGASGLWVGRDDDIAEYKITWNYTTPSAGFAVWVVDEGLYRVWSGSEWIRLGGVVDHGALLGLSDDDHTQYLRTDGTRELTGDWDIGNGRYIATDEIRARDASGLSLQPSGASTGIYIEDNYRVVIGETTGANSGVLVVKRVQDAATSVRVQNESTGTTARSEFICEQQANNFFMIMTGTNYPSPYDAKGVLLTGSGVKLMLEATTGPRVVLDNTGGVFITKGTDFTNANMTIGLTIDQGANDNEILALKSSDVSHPMTDKTETDTYFTAQKTGAAGGAWLRGWADTNIEESLYLQGCYVTPDTTKSTAGTAAILLAASKSGGTSIGGMGADENILAIRDHTISRVIVNQDGTIHTDGDIMPFDADTQNIGTSGSEWDEVWANTVHCDTIAATTISGSWDHGQLTGLSDDDHPIYLPTDGSRGMTGTLSVGTTGGYIKFSGSSAEIGFATDTDLLTLETGVAPSATINGNLLISQGGNDDPILLFRSSDVNHGMTNYTTTDTYGLIRKASASTGAMNIRGWGSSVFGITHEAFASSVSTTIGQGAQAPMVFSGYKKTGAAATVFGNTENVYVLRNSSTVLWQMLGNGDIHQKGDIIPYVDASQDIGALNYMWGNIYTDALTVSSGNITMYGDILPATSDTYDLGHSDAVWDNIWCKTLHTSAGSIQLGSLTLTDDAGALDIDGDITATAFYGDGSNLTGVSVSGAIVAKNAIINGDFNIAQRGTSIASPANGAYLLDRWKYYKTATVNHTVTQDTDVPTQAESGHQSKYSIKVDCTSADASIAAGDFCAFGQLIEGFNIASLDQKEVTLSFWVKGTKTGTHCVAFRSSNSDASYVEEYTINDSLTWEKKSITLTLNDDTGGTWVYDTGIGLQVFWALCAGSDYHKTASVWVSGGAGVSTSNQVNACDSTSNNFWLSQVQLEVGGSASDYEQISIQEQFSQCSRYFWQLTVGGSILSAPCNGYYIGSSVRAWFHTPVQMRALPTMNGFYRWYGSAGGQPVNSLSASDLTPWGFVVQDTVTAPGGTCTLTMYSQTSNLDAEL